MEKIWLDNYPEGVPKEVEVPDISLGQMLEKTTAKYPNNIALAFINNKVSFSKLDEMANRFANVLAKLGVKKGDRVALHLPNTPQLVFAY